MVGDREQTVFICFANIFHPFIGNSVAEQSLVGQIRENLFLLRDTRWERNIRRDNNFLNSLSNFNELCCASLRMCFHPSPFRPSVSSIVMIDVTEKEALFGFVN